MNAKVNTLKEKEKMAFQLATAAVESYAVRCDDKRPVSRKELKKVLFTAFCSIRRQPQYYFLETPLLKRIDDLNNFAAWVNNGARLEDLV